MILFQLGRFTDLFPWVRATAELGFDPGPRFNVAPMTFIPVLTQSDDRFVPLKWGLVPGFSRDAAVGSKMLNARSETVREKPSFRQSFKQTRCLIPADGFYEWEKVEGESQKRPHYIRATHDAGLMFAGIWATTTIADQELSTCAILTTQANAFMSRIHDRMPVILDPSLWRQWLDDTDLDRVSRLMKPASEGLLKSHVVSTRVNKVGIDDPQLLDQVEVEEPRQGLLF
jgi:putative SOS response-associated peptidase YedK